MNPALAILRTDTPWYHRPSLVKWAVGLIIFGAVINLLTLWLNAPFDLSEDETHYWEWARHLDYGYYSKPPGIAWLMWANVHLGQLLGIPADSTAWMRTPAVILSALVGFLGFDLSRRVFRDDRVGLLLMVINAAVPMFVVGAVLLTIDSPMFACWALASWALWRYVETPEQGEWVRQPRWLYLSALAVAVGLLFKPLLIAFPLSVIVMAMASRTLRQRLWSWHLLPAVAIMLCSQIPFILWNSHHDWVTFKHMRSQAGVGQTVKGNPILAFLGRLGEYVGGQVGAMAGFMFMLLVMAIWKAFGARKQLGDAATFGLTFLLALSLPLWTFYLFLTIGTKIQINWPAASYFTGMMVLAGIACRYWTSENRKHQKAWSRWMIFTVIWGLAFTTLAQNLHHFYPLMAQPRKWDPSIKLRGHAQRGQILHDKFIVPMTASLGRKPLLAAPRYGQASSLAFYLPGQPFVYSLMSVMGERMTQYDLWPGLNERRADGTLVHQGEPVLYFSEFELTPEQCTKIFNPAFRTLEYLGQTPVTVNGATIRTIYVYLGSDFRGFPETTPNGRF
ncbi:MAG: glycosyltransferase family 39 protein [Phycisphaerae bacterium]